MYVASFTNSASTQVLIRLGQGKLLGKNLTYFTRVREKKKKEIFVNGLFRCSAFFFCPLSFIVFFPLSAFLSLS